MQAKEKQTLDLETLKKRMNRLKRSSDQCKCRWRSGEENLFAMMKAFKVVVATRSTVGGHGAVRHAFAEVHPHVVATALLACHPKPGRHLCAMRMVPILPETQKNRTDPQSLPLSLLLASPVTSASSCTISIPVRVTYHAHTLSKTLPIPGYTWRVSGQGWVYTTVKTYLLENFKYE